MCQAMAFVFLYFFLSVSWKYNQEAELVISTGMLWRRCFSIFPHVFPMFYRTFFTIEEWKNFPFSRFCEIEEQNVCSWCWFLSIGISGGQPLKYSRQKDLFAGWGGRCVWYCATLELWLQARCKSLLFHSLALYLDESNFHLPDSSRWKNNMNVLGAGF